MAAAVIMRQQDAIDERQIRLGVEVLLLVSPNKIAGGSASEIISPLLGDAKYSNLSSPRCSRGAHRCGGKSDRRKSLASRCSARPGHSWPKVRTSPDRAKKRW